MKMKDWHFTVLFLLAVLGALVMLFSDKIGVTVRPEVVGVFGLVMAFILQQKDSKDKKEEEPKPPEPKPEPPAPTPPAAKYEFTPEMLAALQALADPKAGTAPENSPPGNLAGDNERAADAYGKPNLSKEND